MKILVGTSGYSYKEWKGSFYPEDLPAAKMLSFYAQTFSTVEINNTFYRMPDRKTLEHWAVQVPAGFRFVLKAPQRITHNKKLHGATDDVRYLYETAAVLNGALGAVLFQLPPYFRKDLPLLSSFFDSIPAEQRVAVEFRHSSWRSDDVMEELKRRQVALCIAETDENLRPDLVPTASWGYLRLRRTEYNEDDLVQWAERIQSQPWQEAFVFFKHEDEAKGPRFAAQFLSAIRASSLP